MLLADVNILLYAFREESPSHEAHRAWLTAAVAGPEPFGVVELVLSTFMRIVTHHRIYVEPSTPDRALAFCDSLLAAPAAVPVRSGPRHWAIFADLVRQVGARANTVPDAWLAALAIEHGGVWVTTDAGFARFPGLQWRRALNT